MSLYFVCKHDKIVFVFSPAEEGSWRFSRLSSFQKNKGLEKFVLLYRTSEQTEGWLVVDQTGSTKGVVIGQPTRELQEIQRPEGPPLGDWHVWGSPFVLTATPPGHPPLVLDPPFPLEVPFATVEYAEEGSVARLEITMHSTPIVDSVLEHVLSRLSSILRSLAQRPEMVLFIRSDARNSAVPAMRHIKRFLGFVQDNGSEFVLVVRGHAIVLSSKGILGNTLLTLLRLVQRLFPAPCPELTVSTMQAADAFLADLAKSERVAQTAAQVAVARAEALELTAPMRSRASTKETSGMFSGPPSPKAATAGRSKDGGPAADEDIERDERAEEVCQDFHRFEPIVDLGATPVEPAGDNLERAGDKIDTTTAVSSPTGWPWFCSSCKLCKSGQKPPFR